MRQIIKFGKLVCLILIYVILLCGCKPSPALIEEVYTQDAEETEQDELQMDENDSANEEQSEDLAPTKKTASSDDYRERNRDLSVYDEEGGKEVPASEQIIIQKNEVAVTPEAKIAKSTTQLSDESDAIETLIETPDLVKEIVPKKMIDVNGEYFTVPEKVDSAGAVGEAAVIVSMLGGFDRLRAVSEDFSSNSLIQNAFNSNSEDTPKVLWKGNGSSGINEEDFNRLIALSPQVCFEFSGENTFNEDQYKALEQADIVCVTLPRPTTTDNIKQAVRIVGEVLGDRSTDKGTNAPQLAQEYINYMNSVINEMGNTVKRATCNLVDYDNDKTVNGTKYLSSGENDTTGTTFSGKYSIYISRWDDSTSYKIYNSLDVFMEGKGAAVARSGYSSSPLSYYMSLAGVINTPAMFPDFGVPQNWYVNPMIPSTKSMQLSGNYKLPSGYCLTLTNNDTSSNTGARTNGLGNGAVFPAIIVDSQSLKSKIKSDSLWKAYGYVRAKNGDAQNFGYLADDGSIIESTIIDSYDIYVNPRGIGNWSDGSVESILEPVWLAWKFYGAYTEDEVKEKIKDFYQKFYRYELSNVQLKIILEGPR
jgi:ABC-type Fe3+-hydroxamate transport system substrate-binding protein